MTISKKHTKKSIKKSKRSRYSRGLKRSRKVRNMFTTRNKLYKLQNGGSEHINKPSAEMVERQRKYRNALLARAKEKTQVPLPIPTSITTSQISSNVNLELVKQKIMQSLAAGK